MNKKEFKFNLGDVLKDKISGFSGVVVARTSYLTGCCRYSLQAKVLNEGKPIDWQNFDEDQIEVIKEEKPMKIKTDKSKGGVKPSAQKRF